MEDEKKARRRKQLSLICLIGFVSVIAYIFFAAYEGLWPFIVIGYVPLYIQLAYPLGLYLLYWGGLFLLILGLYFQNHSKEILIFILLIGISVFIIMYVVGTLPAPS